MTDFSSPPSMKVASTLPPPIEATRATGSDLKLVDSPNSISEEPSVGELVIPAQNRHILTISLEDYFQVLTFRKLIPREQWTRFDTRLERNTQRVLDLLDRFGIRATFFVLGWIADRRPDIVREVAKRGHEVASKGYYPTSFRGSSPEELRDNLTRARDALEAATGRRVVGCRIPQTQFGREDLWALDLIAEENYRYDSSMVPSFWSFRSEPWRRFVHQHRYGDKILWEFPISTYRFLGCNLPMSGGNYIRQFPTKMVRRLANRWTQNTTSPLVMYFHVWELDPEQVRIDGAPALSRIRHYRNLDRMARVWEEYFRTYHFVSIAEHMGLDLTGDQVPARVSREAEAAVPYVVQTSPEARTAVTVVVPCYNEERILPYLANTLRSVRESLDEYQLSFLFVDDGSTDRTQELLDSLFASWANCKVVRHPRNLGVAAAIMTGIRHAETEIVCSIDCDCTYDPHALKEMIPKLAAGVDVVTASPYHPLGHVRNVPGWRLGLSKVSSFLYRRVLRQKLYTYTSCFRVYRRAALRDLDLRNGHFIGVAEMLGMLDLQHAQIVEHPATLEVRLIGRSKMKVVKAAAGHLALMARLLLLRLFRSRRVNSDALVRIGSAVFLTFISRYKDLL